jgi:hypothetical protein
MAIEYPDGVPFYNNVVVHIYITGIAERHPAFCNYRVLTENGYARYCFVAIIVKRIKIPRRFKCFNNLMKRISFTFFLAKFLETNDVGVFRLDNFYNIGLRLENWRLSGFVKIPHIVLHDFQCNFTFIFTVKKVKRVDRDLHVCSQVVPS